MILIVERTSQQTQWNTTIDGVNIANEDWHYNEIRGQSGNYIDYVDEQQAWRLSHLDILTGMRVVM